MGTSRQRHSEDKGQTLSPTDHDFVLPRQVGGLAQQLALGHGDGAGGLSDQHAVVEPHPSRRWGDQIPPLSAQKDNQQGAELGEKLINGPMKISNFPRAGITSAPTPHHTHTHTED